MDVRLKVPQDKLPALVVLGTCRAHVYRSQLWLSIPATHVQFIAVHSDKLSRERAIAPNGRIGQ